MAQFERMEFDTREWSTEKIEKLCKKLKSEGYTLSGLEKKALASISTIETGKYFLFDVEAAREDRLTTYEEYMGEEVKSSMREVVLTHDTVSIDSVRDSKLYGVLCTVSKAIIYQVSGVYTYSVLDMLNKTKLHTFNSLEEVINFCLGKGNKVYEFDDPKQLLHWLLE